MLWEQAKQPAISEVGVYSHHSTPMRVRTVWDIRPASAAMVPIKREAYVFHLASDVSSTSISGMEYL